MVIGLGMCGYIGECLLAVALANASVQPRLPVVTCTFVVKVCLMRVNFGAALYSVGRDDDDSACVDINASDVFSFPFSENNGRIMQLLKCRC